MHLHPCPTILLFAPQSILPSSQPIRYKAKTAHLSLFLSSTLYTPTMATASNTAITYKIVYTLGRSPKSLYHASETPHPSLPNSDLFVAPPRRSQENGLRLKYQGTVIPHNNNPSVGPEWIYPGLYLLCEFFTQSLGKVDRVVTPSSQVNAAYTKICCLISIFLCPTQG